MKIIRASEVGTYQFCHRAWWYQLQGYEPANQVQLEKGKQYHARHSYVVTASGCLRTLAYALLLVGVLSGLIYLVQFYL